jgi:hypothetical protein
MNSTPQSTSSGVVQVEACIHLKALRCKSLCTINFIVFWKSLGRASGQSCVSCAGAGGCDYSAGEGGCDHIAGAGCCDSHRDGARCWGWGWGSCNLNHLSSIQGKSHPPKFSNFHNALHKLSRPSGKRSGISYTHSSGIPASFCKC